MLSTRSSSIGGVEPTAENSAYALSGTPDVYLIPCGTDSMRAPLSGEEDIIRNWKVQDQALPLHYNLAASVEDVMLYLSTYSHSGN